LVHLGWAHPPHHSLLSLEWNERVKKMKSITNLVPTLFHEIPAQFPIFIAHSQIHQEEIPGMFLIELHTKTAIKTSIWIQSKVLQLLEILEQCWMDLLDLIVV
jgi:hypothetical protein